MGGVNDTEYRKEAHALHPGREGPPKSHIEERWSIHHMEEALVDGPYGSKGLALRVRAFVFVAMRRFVFIFFGFSGAAMKEELI